MAHTSSTAEPLFVTAPQIRPIDRWFVEEVLPHECAYLSYASKVTRNAQEAGDIVQEAYVKLFTLDGWSAIANPPAYVTRMIHNQAVERVRRARVVPLQPLPTPAAMDVADDTPDAFRVVASRRQMARVQQAIAALPERCRIALVRRRFAEESPREIASDLGISVSTFEKRLARAVELLSHALAPQERHPDELCSGTRPEVVREKILL